MSEIKRAEKRLAQRNQIDTRNNVSLYQARSDQIKVKRNMSYNRRKVHKANPLNKNKNAPF
jgi:hypothetical protein